MTGARHQTVAIDAVISFFLQEAKLENVKEQLRLMEDKNLQALFFPPFLL